MATDHKLEILLTARDATAKVFAAVNSKIQGLQKNVLALSGGLALLAGGAGFGALVKASFDANDALAKTADRLGITTEGLGELRHAAELTGAGTKTLDMALQRMTRRIAEAAAGSGAAKGALEELGLSAQELARLSPDQAFSQIAEAMKSVENQSDRVRLAFKLFDSEGVKLLNTLDLGAQDLAEIAQEARDLGLAISRVDAAKIESANDAFYKMQQSIKGVATIFAVELAPGLEEAANQFTEFVKQNRELIGLKVREYFEDIRIALEKIWKLISYHHA